MTTANLPGPDYKLPRSNAVDFRDDAHLPLFLYLCDYDPMMAPRPWLERKWNRHDGVPGKIVSGDQFSGVMLFPGCVYRDFKCAPSTPPTIPPLV